MTKNVYSNLAQTHLFWWKKANSWKIDFFNSQPISRAFVFKVPVEIIVINEGKTYHVHCISLVSNNQNFEGRILKCKETKVYIILFNKANFSCNSSEQLDMKKKQL